MSFEPKQLQALKTIREHIRPDGVWVSRTRAELERKMRSGQARTVETRGHSLLRAANIFVSRKFMLSLKPTFTVIMAVLIATGGWIASVQASFNSVPGDILWSVKLATEKTQLAVASVRQSEEKEAQLHLKFASRRAKEVKQVIEEKSADASKKAETAMDRLNVSLENAEKSLQEVQKKENASLVVALVKDVNVATEEITRTLKEGADIAGTQDAAGADLTKKIVESENAAEQMGLSAVEAALTVGASEGTAVSSELKEQANTLVEAKITKLIENAAEDVENAKKLTDKIQTEVSGKQAQDIVVVSSTLATVDVPSSTTPLISAVSTTPQLIAPPPSVSVKDVIEKVDKAAETVKDRTEAIKTLVEGSKLVEAVQKVREMRDAAKDSVKDAVAAGSAVKQAAEQGAEQAADAVLLENTENTQQTNMKTEQVQ